MFGSKLRAWMEAVRPKKKQHRKEKQGKNATVLNTRPTTSNHTVTWKKNCLVDSEKQEVQKDQKEATMKYVKPNNEKHNELSRYSATNLSSPESAYSTGYSTDGTSPGAPPEYSINSSDKKVHVEKRFENRLNPEVNTQTASSSKTVKWFLKTQPPEPVSYQPQEIPKVKESIEKQEPTSSASSAIFFGNVSDSPSPGLVSPRQRNRIRTNPWLPGGTTSAVASPLLVRQEMVVTPSTFRKFRNSPVHHKYLSPATNRRSLSSSSCSSLSVGQNHSFEHHFPRSFSDEDDCTLNEMMGKYDESYVYEKETDILSDSDPTDCESDIDTGQDGGDEDDNADVELDFIDNGSYIETESNIDNTGHCLYFIPPDIQRKKSSRKRATRKSKELSDRRRRSSTSKKCHKHSSDKPRHWSLHQDGSKSAGATPISVRKSSLKPTYSRGQDESLKKRSNSVSFQRDPINIIDKKDREADLKYRELIGQAEQIIRTMNLNGLSPRRLPGPTNKRVELLRSTECTKTEMLFKNNKIPDETIIPNSNITPSTAVFRNNRFSPKKNHITNFINNNSPVLVRKDLQVQSPIAIRRNLPEEMLKSPSVIRKQIHSLNEEHCQKKTLKGEDKGHLSGKLEKISVKDYQDVSCGTPTVHRKHHQPKSILHITDKGSIGMLSPRHRKEVKVCAGSSSSEEESFHRSKKRLSKSCPQSEPMRRKVYFERNTIHVAKDKNAVFTINKEIPNILSENTVGSSENLRHHVLLNTIQNLKRNLETQSASLQQNYKGRHSLYKY